MSDMRWAVNGGESHKMTTTKKLNGILKKLNNKVSKKNQRDAGNTETKMQSQYRSIFPGINLFCRNSSSRRRTPLEISNKDPNVNGVKHIKSTSPSILRFRRSNTTSVASDYGRLDHAGLVPSVRSTSKSVSFYPRQLVIPGPHRLDLIALASIPPSRDGDFTTPTSGQEVLWWSQSDYEHFRHTSMVLARTLIPPKNDHYARQYLTCRKSSVTAASYLQKVWEDEHDDKWWCKFGHSRRGLEHITQIGIGQERQRAQEDSIAAVLEEQNQMLSADNTEGWVDPRRLAHVSIFHSKHAREHAQRVGMEDAQVALAIRYGSTKSNAALLAPPSVHDHMVNLSNTLHKNNFLDANTDSALQRHELRMSLSESIISCSAESTLSCSTEEDTEGKNESGQRREDVKESTEVSSFSYKEGRGKSSMTTRAMGFGQNRERSG